MSQENLALVDRFMNKVFAEGDFQAGGEMLADGYVAHTPDGQSYDKQGQLQRWDVNLKAFDLGGLTIHDQFAVEDKVVTRWSLKMRHKGEFMGIPATGNEVTMESTSIQRVEGGKIVESWRHSNEMRLLQQLGLEIPPAR